MTKKIKMKTRIILSFLFVMYVFCGKTQPSIDKKAKDILDGVSKNVKTFTSYCIDFSYSSEGLKGKTNESMAGKITIQGIKYKLEIPKQTVFCDGKTVWTYLKDANEVQINNLSTDEDALNPSSIFTLWEKGYKYKFIKEEMQNKSMVEVIDLTPLKGKSYFKVRLNIDKNKKLLNSAIVYNKDGGTYTYKITNFNQNVVVNDAMFTFNKASYPKVEVVDMR